MFEKITPEHAGISSRKVLEFIKTLDEKRCVTHSIIMARGNGIFAECYYRPFHRDFLHRMYSVSKSFVALSVGLAETEGLLRLSDRLIDYFPEYKNENSDALLEEVTIRDMLTMQSSIASFIPWFGKCSDRAQTYFQNKSVKIPGTLYHYDSVGSYLLGCIVEKLTGKTFLEYLKEKVLSELGFSKDSYTLYAPGGYTMGDSGVMCTSRDLLITARLLMNFGNVGGKQYISRRFMEDAVTKQTDNDTGGILSYGGYGYGYLIWMAPDGGFSLVGMGDQLAVCDVKRDFIFVITSDNQGFEASSRTLIYNELYRTVISSFSDSQTEEDDQAYKELREYLESRSLISQRGNKTGKLCDMINGKKYLLCENPMNIGYIKLGFSDECGTLEFEKDMKVRNLKFGMTGNVTGKFPDDRRNLICAGDLGEGSYDCASSAAWTKENKLVIKSQIIDTYFGCLNIELSFKDRRVSVRMSKSGQYILEDFCGYGVGYESEE